MRKQRNLGLSLIEIIVVIAIITTLLGVLAAVVVPRAKEAARMSQNRSQLKQVVLAINIYMLDWDGGPPIRLSGLVEDELLYDPSTCVPYAYHLGAGQIWQSGRRPSDFGFDDAVDPVVSCVSCSKHKGEFEIMQFPCSDGRMSSYRIPLLDVGEQNFVLGVKLGGGIGYFPEPAEWIRNLPPPPRP